MICCQKKFRMLCYRIEILLLIHCKKLKIQNKQRHTATENGKKEHNNLIQFLAKLKLFRFEFFNSEKPIRLLETVVLVVCQATVQPPPTTRTCTLLSLRIFSLSVVLVNVCQSLYISPSVFLVAYLFLPLYLLNK
jgi:hypothetical protein